MTARGCVPDRRSPVSVNRLVLPLTAAAALVAGCGQDSMSSGGDLTTTFDTIDGVIRVANAGEPPEWQLTQMASIGPKSLTDTGSRDEFGSVYDVAFGPDQSVFVADAVNHEVRVFGLDGAHRFTFGRSGEGPGEFARLYSVAWLGDRLMALDSQLGRISEFSAEGQFLGQRRIRGGLSGEPGWVRFYPVGADDEEWAAGNSDYRALRDTFPLMRCDPSRPGRPGAKPFIEAIDIASDGKLWVEVVREAGNRWEIFDTDGRLLANLSAPARGHLPPTIGTDHVLTVRKGNFDLDHVDVWRIERGGE